MLATPAGLFRSRAHLQLDVLPPRQQLAMVTDRRTQFRGRAVERHVSDPV